MLPVFATTKKCYTRDTRYDIIKMKQKDKKSEKQIKPRLPF